MCLRAATADGEKFPIAAAGCGTVDFSSHI